MSISGTLLATLADPAFQSRVYGIVDCGSLLWHLPSDPGLELARRHHALNRQPAKILDEDPGLPSGSAFG